MTLTLRAMHASAAGKGDNPQAVRDASSTPPPQSAPANTTPSASGNDNIASQGTRNMPDQGDVALTVPSSPLGDSLFSPPTSPRCPTQAATPDDSAVPFLSITDSTPSPEIPSISPLSQSTTTTPFPPAFSSSQPAFLRSTSHRRRTPATSKKIPNTARVRTTTVGELPDMDDRRKRRRSSSTTQAIGLRNPPLSVSIPKRSRLDLSKLKFTKRSDPQTFLDQSRSSSPEVPLAVGLAPSSSAPSDRGSKLRSAAPHKAARAPYPSPALTTTPTSAFSTAGPAYSPDLFCDHDGSPLRFHLDDDSRAEMAMSILDHGGELAPEWDSTFVIRSTNVLSRSKSAVKGNVTSCPLAVSVKWVKESLRAGKLLPTRSYSLRF